jgi:hypothetical protein
MQRPLPGRAEIAPVHHEHKQRVLMADQFLTHLGGSGAALI